MENTTFISKLFDLFSDKNGHKPKIEVDEEQTWEELPEQVSLKPNAWGQSGRSTMMQTRNMMQLRAFHK